MNAIAILIIMIIVILWLVTCGLSAVAGFSFARKLAPDTHPERTVPEITPEQKEKTERAAKEYTDDINGLLNYNGNPDG